MYRTDFIIHEPEEQYHAKSRSGECLSSHMLADFRNSPRLYWQKVIGAVEEKKNPAFALGSAAHKMILEGKESFESEYIVSDGPVNPKTGAAYGATTKAYADWLATQEKKVVSGADYQLIEKLRDSVWAHPAARDLLSTGVAEGVARVNFQGVLCQIRMDWFNPERGLVDYKTCAELRYFESDARRYGYIYQMSFYRTVIWALTGDIVPVHIIATEKCEPYSTGVWEIVPSVLDQSERINNAALFRLDKCRQTCEWPTGYETVRLIDSL